MRRTVLQGVAGVQFLLAVSQVVYDAAENTLCERERVFRRVFVLHRAQIRNLGVNVRWFRYTTD